MKGLNKMELITKEIEAIASDVYTITGKAKEYKLDIDRGINVNHTPKWDDSISKQDKINNLFYYLTEAKQDMDTLQDDLKDIKNKLDDLLDMVQYEQVVNKINWRIMAAFEGI